MSCAVKDRSSGAVILLAEWIASAQEYLTVAIGCESDEVIIVSADLVAAGEASIKVEFVSGGHVRRMTTRNLDFREGEWVICNSAGDFESDMAAVYRVLCPSSA